MVTNVCRFLAYFYFWQEPETNKDKYVLNKKPTKYQNCSIDFISDVLILALDKLQISELNNSLICILHNFAENESMVSERSWLDTV